MGASPGGGGGQPRNNETTRAESYRSPLEKINKKDMQLEKQIMQQQDCKFIVKLYYTLADQYYVYLLMVSHLFESYNMTYII